MEGARASTSQLQCGPDVDSLMGTAQWSQVACCVAYVYIPIVTTRLYNELRSPRDQVEYDIDEDITPRSSFGGDDE